MQSIPPPPLEGCLYCHSEGSIVLIEPRRFLGLGGVWPLLRCKHCGSVAQVDLAEAGWRIRYRRVNPASQYYYVRLRFEKAGWLTANQALHLSTEGYVQRKRVQQVNSGDLKWLRPIQLEPSPPLMGPDEYVFLSLRAVTYKEAPPSGLFVRPDQGKILDSGKFYVTDQKLHLLGQRHDWSHPFSDIEKIDYDELAWTVYLNDSGELHQYRGVNVSDQFDAQLVASVIQALCHIQRHP